VLSHIILRDGTPDDLVTDIRPNFAGAVTVGEDLAAFEVGR
jgi:hypothetical protein